tara:strand:- start:2207 stop:2428 length:222 start_codon:yes stop_codon:yes gene_type:complete
LYNQKIMASTKVKLKTKDDVEISVDIDHAQRMLQFQAKLGREDWLLISKKYQFKDNVIKRKPSIKDSKTKEEG